MRVMNTLALETYIQQTPEVKERLLAWLHDVESREWSLYTDVLNHFPRAIALKGGHEINFEIHLHSCYVLALLHYPTQVLSILSIGSFRTVLLPRLYNHFQGGQDL